MKRNYRWTGLLAVLICSGLSIKAQDADSTGLPGDNFSLPGALEMFKKAKNPEQFEKLLNSQDNKVNNLDLNGDGKTDYIRVAGKKEKDVNIFVLQALVSAKEKQDIAVIEVERTGDKNAMVQIVGDEDIYGEEKIVEPGENDDQAVNYNGAAGMRGPNAEAFSGIIINVWGWPCVQFIFAPAYVVWDSPWDWGYYPTWWSPWRPMYWHVYRPYYYGFYHRYHYTVVHTHRIAPARVMYRPHRVTSVTVYNRNRVAVNHYRTTRNVQPSRASIRTSHDSRHAPSRTDRVNDGSRSRSERRSFDGPNRDINRSSTTVTGPNGSVTRDRRTFNGPTRDISRSSTTVTSPNGSVTRDRRTFNGPTRDINRSSTTVTSPNRNVNRSSTNVTTPNRNIDRERRTFNGPNRNVNRSSTTVTRSNSSVSRQANVQAPRRTPPQRSEGQRTRGRGN